jgi:chemotaxis protein methyltransferase CheR
MNCFRAMPPEAWRLFLPHPTVPDTWTVVPEARRMVTFAVHNLMDRPPAGFTADLISCRNTLIYFDEEGTRRAEAAFVAAARPGTILLLGPAERLRHTTVFRPIADWHPQILHWPAE